ncbi:hypothetical protein [Tropicimonas aquimaris]|uniref:Uncharacterized protein n=1 Tax=Tropicimonas aquimaris TaxID=914152 RepID=A0ABW3IXT4_9RHOB
MPSSPSRLRRTLSDLLLAMLNATLILVALCLFLGLRLAGTVEDVTERLTGNLASVAPLRDGVGEMTEELRALRADLAAVTTQAGEASSERVAALNARLETLDSRLETAQDRFAELGERIDSAIEDPSALIDRAVRAAADQTAQNLAGMAGCALPASGAPDLAVNSPGS